MLKWNPGTQGKLVSGYPAIKKEKMKPGIKWKSVTLEERNMKP